LIAEPVRFAAARPAMANAAVVTPKNIFIRVIKWIAFSLKNKKKFGL